MANLMGKLSTSLLKGSKWTVWNIFFGLLPVWLAGLFSLLLERNSVAAVEEILFKDNALMFFSVAVITAITIDFEIAIASSGYAEITKYQNIIKRNRWVSIIVVVASALVYALVYPGTEKIDNITIFSFAIFVFTVIYVFCLKCYQIYCHLDLMAGGSHHA